MTYDAVNRVRKVGSSLALFTHALDDAIKTIAYGNGEAATHTYDSRSRPTRVLVKSGSTTRMDLNYTYDGTGNVLTLKANGEASAETYAYDWLNRLTSSTGPWGTTTIYMYQGLSIVYEKVGGSSLYYFH